MKLWVVAQIKSDSPKHWELQGVFSSAEKAEAACRDANYCVMPGITLDEELPLETTEGPGDYYPRA